MRNKSKVVNNFKEFEAMATNMTGEKIKLLGCDNVGEYTSKVVGECLKSKSIQMQFSVPRAPVENGVSWRMNGALLEMARSILHRAELSEIYWAEAVLTAVIIRNKSPTTAVTNITPFECFLWKEARCF